MKLWRIVVPLIVVLAAAVPTASVSAPTAWTTTPVASGLDSPRGLAFAPNGTLYVAEAGHGGDVCRPNGASVLCIGTTSRISRVDVASGAVSPVVKGLYSRAVPNEGITGVDGLSASGGRLYAAQTAFPQELGTFTCTGQPSDCASSLSAARAQAGRVITFTPGGTWKALANVGGDNYTWSLTHTSLTRSPPNSNPYGVAGVSGGVYVADAGNNTLDLVTASGKHTIISGIPLPAPGGFPGDGVPTCVTMIRGNLYAADLAGRAWRRAGAFTPTALPVPSAGHSLLHHVTGCAADAGGDLFFVDMWGTPGPPIPAGPGSAANTGSVVELAANGSASVVAGGLNFPNGIAVAKDGSLYVTTNSICTATGTPLPFCGNGGGLVHIAQG